MTKNISKESLDAIQQQVYDDNLSKPIVGLNLRKLCELTKKRLGLQLVINSTKINNIFIETYKLHCDEICFDVKLSSFKHVTLRNKIVKNPSSMREFGIIKTQLMEYVERFHDEDSAKLIDLFISSIKRSITNEFIFQVEKIEKNEFLILLESDSLKLSIEFYLVF